MPELPKYYSREFQDFISRCLERNVAERWDIAMLCQHDFLRGAADLKHEWVKELKRHKTRMAPKS